MLPFCHIAAVCLLLSVLRSAQVQSAGPSYVTQCPYGFTYVSSVRGCYKPVTQSLSWDVATLRCKSYHRSAHLVFINNTAESAAVNTILARQSVSSCVVSYSWVGIGWWIGGQRIDPTQSTAFVWKSTSPHDPNTDGYILEMTYTNWNTGEPNFAGDNPWPRDWKESCIHLLRNNQYRWNDLACAIPQCFVCELDML